MTKISEKSYRLPIIEALSSFELFENGTTLPMRIRGVDTHSGERGHYVVKFKNQNRMSITSSAFEFLGGWMAAELGLFVAEPVVINISDEFIDTLAARDGFKAAQQSSGLNYGSKYVPGLKQIPTSGFRLTNEQFNQAKQLFVFDLFIQNIDRGHQKPNVGLSQNDLFIYDHELAFSFLRQLPFLRSQSPWNLNPSDSELYKKHFFFPYLKGSGANYSQEVENLSNINDNFWRSVKSHMPHEFQVDELSEIEEYASAFIDHLNLFSSSIQNTLN